MKLKADGIYQDSHGTLYERPTIDGRRTWRKLDSVTVRDAKAEMAGKRTLQAQSALGLVRDPYAPPAATVAELAEGYIKAGCPKKSHHARTGTQLAQEVDRIDTVLRHLGSYQADGLKPKDAHAFAAARRSEMREGFTGGRTIDMELSTLMSLLNWSIGVGKLDKLPPVCLNRPKFRQETVVHCRDNMPQDANELHALAAYLFDDPRSESLGWQLLLEAFTGCRTAEVLKMRWDAKPRQAGFIEGDWLWLERSKGGVNPFAQIHPDLRDLLEALKRWRDTRYAIACREAIEMQLPVPELSPYFVPSNRCPGKPCNKGSLTHALSRIGPIIAGEGAVRTSHGLRAYYVTVRRSQGISDAQVAAEIGDKSGASIIVSTYGAIPDNWRGGKSLDWIPQEKEPAWSCLDLGPENVVQMQSCGL